MPLCPCGSSKTYDNCCQLWHQGAAAPTAELLMRSRYSAFCLAATTEGLVDYLIATHHSGKRANDDRKILQQTIANTRWLGLQIVESTAGQTGDDSGTVEFIATFEEAGQLGQLHERSRFVKEQDRWYYLDGAVFPSELKATRNDPCPCGSGKKFKKCHG